MNLSFLGGRTIKKPHHDAAGKNILTDATHSTAKQATGLVGESWKEYTFHCNTGNGYAILSHTLSSYDPLFGSLMSCLYKQNNNFQ